MTSSDGETIGSFKILFTDFDHILEKRRTQIKEILGQSVIGPSQAEIHIMLEWTLRGSFSKVGRFTLFFCLLARTLRYPNEAKIMISFGRVAFY